MVGYLATGFIINLRPENYSWRLSILIQAALEFPIIFILYFINNSDLDMFEHKTNIESVPIHPKLTAWAQVKQLICNNIFMCASFLVCISFFVVVGIQFWGTSYMIITMDTSPHNAMIIYAFITITAPILGVVASGFVVDYLGGYKGANRLVALKMIFAFSVLCVLISVPLSFIYNVFLFAPLLWLQIFFGGCNIPAGIGIVVDSVEPYIEIFFLL